jgi:hypothetical protein
LELVANENLYSDFVDPNAKRIQFINFVHINYYNPSKTEIMLFWRNKRNQSYARKELRILSDNKTIPFNYIELDTSYKTTKNYNDKQISELSLIEIESAESQILPTFAKSTNTNKKIGSAVIYIAIIPNIKVDYWQIAKYCTAVKLTIYDDETGIPVCVGYRAFKGRNIKQGVMAGYIYRCCRKIGKNK